MQPPSTSVDPGMAIDILNFKEQGCASRLARDELPAVAKCILNTSTALLATSLPELSFWIVLTRARNSYAESVMATICASGGSDEYCDTAGSL